MELRDYLRILRRRWLVVVACLVGVVAVAALVTFNTTAQYASTTRLFVSTSPSNTGEAYQGGLFSEQRVTSYADLATGQELSQRVIDATGLQLDPADLAGRVDATVVPDTVILELTLTDPNPRVAQRITRSYAQQLIDFVSELETPPGRHHPVLKATVVDPATFSTAQVSPNVLRNMGLAVVLGLLLGLGVAVLRDLLDTSVKSGEDLAEVTPTPVLGGIQFDPNIAKGPLISSLDSHDPRVEAFRILRTNLQFVDVDTEKKAFVFTSSVPGEGKTSTASNVALALHTTGQRTLLVDGDLRRPQLADLFGLESAVGLTSVLLGRIPLPDAVQTHLDSGLHVLTSGKLPPNPAELLQSQAMKELLTDAVASYDVVIIDTPPLLPVTDAALLSAQVDGAVVVIRQGKTSRDQIGHSLERLQAVGARALGVTLNMVPYRRRGGRYGYGGYGYGYSYAPDPGRRARRPERRVRH